MDDYTRRGVLRAGTALGAMTLGASVMGGAAASQGRSENAKRFGRVWADGVLYRTNVVKVLDDEPMPGDRIYFVNDGTPASLPPNGAVANAGVSPFVSESKPGDRDWNGGQWVHYSVAVVDASKYAFPLTADTDVFEAAAAGAVTVTKGRPEFEGAPPDFFICPLNGKA